MRLLLIADTHVPKRARDLPAPVWDEVERADAVIHAGDWVDLALCDELVIGIGVDFAIHYVERFRELYDATGSTSAALAGFFEEPARALTRNALIVALGFTPLFLSSLVPYLVVGAFLSGILLTSWLTTIVVLPAVTSFIHRREEAADDTVVDLTSAQLVGTP